MSKKLILEYPEADRKGDRQGRGDTWKVIRLEGDKALVADFITEKAQPWSDLGSLKDRKKGYEENKMSEQSKEQGEERKERESTVKFNRQ